jgi:putative flippase GtrA
MTGRVVRFYIVGLLGTGVQLAALAALTRVLGLNYLISTALAVEIAVVHNFVWHDRWTWPGRPSSERLNRLWRFNASTGAISIIANVFLTAVLVDAGGLPYLVANGIAIAIASLATYCASESFVFRVQPCVCTRALR